jgi:hypothetical protein
VSLEVPLQSVQVYKDYKSLALLRDLSCKVVTPVNNTHSAKSCAPHFIKEAVKDRKHQ